MSRCVHVECQIGAYGCGSGGKANEELYQAIDRQTDRHTDGRTQRLLFTDHGHDIF